MVAATARWLAAYAERHCGSYRATWWVHAGTEPGMRADLVDLGLRLGWVRRDEAEEQSFTKVIDRLSHEGESILLIYDSAIDANTLKPYFTARGAAHVLVTSNARAWRGVAVPVEIRVWTKDIGADYLIVRTGGTEEDRAAAEELAVLLDELPLAHEQAAAYCDELEIPFDEYRRRFETAPVQMLDDADASGIRVDGGKDLHSCHRGCGETTSCRRVVDRSC